MLNDDRQSQLTRRTPLPHSAQARSVNQSSLLHWIQQVLESSQAHIKLRLRGNNLYVLCEQVECPSEAEVVRCLSQAFSTVSLEQLLPSGAPEIHRVICYGRVLGHAQPVWSREITLIRQGGRESVEAAAKRSSQPKSADVDCPSLLTQARQGDPIAIAHYLSQRLNYLGVGIRTKVDPASLTESTHPKRLLVLCESGYTPDPSLLADPIAQQLRELELTQFRDAVVFGQVSGESRPEWMIRVDLTPPEERLREWAHWGDVQAIARLLNRPLHAHAIRLTALLKETTLHLSCTQAAGGLPEQALVTAVIVPLLQTLAPQGIQSAVVYGVPTPTTADSPTTAPGWVYPLELTTPQTQQALPALEQARQGDLRSLTFVLTRLLNPDLDATLATGGIRVQIRQKGDLLHILTEAPNCPRQEDVVTAVVRCLKPLQIAAVAGVRLYGRRSGQKQPLWHYGVDFGSRSPRLVPEATPEFAASDAHVEALLSPSGAIVLWSELPDEGLSASLKRLYTQLIASVQRSLIRTQIFIPIENPALNTSLVPMDAANTQAKRQRLQVALLWGAIGTLLVLQTDWLLGYWLRQSQPQAVRPSVPPVAQPAPPTPSLPAIQLNQKPQAGGFDKTPFTQPGTTVIPEATQSGSDLPASPWQPKAETILNQPGEDYPSFNSRQLDAQIELYRRYLEINGAPDVLVVGSSRALRGVDPIALETALAQQGYANVQVFNFGINGATAQVVDFVVRQMLPPDQLPKLIVFADGARAFNSGRQDITYNGVLASAGYKSIIAGNLPIPTSALAEGPNDRSPADQPTNIDDPVTLTQLHQQWNDQLNQRLAGVSGLYTQRDRLKEQLREQFTALLPKQLTTSNLIVTSDSLIDSSPAAAAAGAGVMTEGQSWVDIDGFLPLSVQFNPITYYQKYARVAGDYDSDYESFTLQGMQTDAMIALASYAQKREIPLVFVNLPLTQEYLDPVRKRHEETFQQYMRQLAAQQGFFYRNLGDMMLAKPYYFSDPSHLNRYGAYEVSQRLAQDVMIPWQITR